MPESASYWFIEEIDVTGSYTNGPGPASSVTLTIYKDRKGKPGKIAVSRGNPLQWTLQCTDNAGSFACVLPESRHVFWKLNAGTYWLSVVANCALATCGNWNWTENTVVTGNPALWENPNDGWDTGCSKWQPLANCGFGAPADLAFTLKGE